LPLGDQHPIEAGQSLGLKLVRQFASDIQLGLRPELQRDQLARSRTSKTVPFLPATLDEGAAVCLVLES